jgi:hypothetical protein
MIRSFCAAIAAAVVFSIVLPVQAQTGSLKPQLGTWKRGNSTVKLDPVGNGFHFLEEGRDNQGKVMMRIEYTVESFDGKNYPWKAWDAMGKPITIADTISFQKVDDYTYDFVNKLGDKVVVTQKWVVSKDGKTRTISFTPADKPTQTFTYEKQ